MKVIGSFCLFVSLFCLGCVHAPTQPGPWDLIENTEARSQYLMLQQASGQIDYKTLYYNIRTLSAMYPDEEIITITKAAIYADYGQSLSSEKEKEHKKRAIETLKPFAERKYENPISAKRILALNHYLHHSGQFKKQYDLGHEVVKNGGMGGEVLIAIGGSMHALELDQKGKSNDSRELAIEARNVWESLYNLNNRRMRQAAEMNSYYISTLALSGDCDQAMQLYFTKLVNSPRFLEMHRWYKQFDPRGINNCKTSNSLSSR